MNMASRDGETEEEDVEEGSLNAIVRERSTCN
jgi:hypothetical protein